MSTNSNDNGRAYEYSCIQELYKYIKNLRPVTIEQNSALKAAKRAWDKKTSIHDELTKSAVAMILPLIEREPLVLEGDDELVLKIQMDEKGEEGDVRDIVIARKTMDWEIGLSIKHNHSALKHSRLGKSIDFGTKWYSIKCSQEYWDAVKPIFDYLEEEKEKKTKFNELPNKEQRIYRPLLQAFMDELNRTNKGKMPERLAAYLLGRTDYYKIICQAKKKTTLIQTFNFRGDLNVAGNTAPKQSVMIAKMPTKIEKLEFKKGRGSNTTVIMSMDNGWGFSFRIHNAEEYVASSLKFDIQLKNKPKELEEVKCSWTT